MAGADELPFWLQTDSRWPFSFLNDWHEECVRGDCAEIQPERKTQSLPLCYKEQHGCILASILWMMNNLAYEITIYYKCCCVYELSLKSIGKYFW